MKKTSSSNEIDVSIIVPAYNEEKNIPLLAEKFSQMFNQSKIKGEVILVDDGSTDGTLEEAKECGGRYDFLRVTSHRTNQGLTAALSTGFSQARGSIFVFYPADLQYDPADIPRMVDKINEGKDIVTGWKQGRYGTKRFVSVIYNWLSRKLFKVKVHDLNSVKAFKREVVEDIPLRRDWHRYMVVLAADRGFKVGEVKVNLYPRRFGKSKFGGFWRIPIGVLDLISVKFQISFMKKPMLLFGSIGLILFLLGLISGAVALYMRLVLGQGFRPLLYLVILLVLSGLTFFVLGFLAEAIVGVREKVEDIERKFKLPPENQDGHN